MSRFRNVAILVTASRDWTDIRAIRRVLLEIQKRHNGSTKLVLVHGSCRGGDDIADNNARTLGWSVLPMPALWKRRPGGAGTYRNGCMLRVLGNLRECGYECEVHGFPLPQSRGTLHMMSIAKAAGFEVIDHSKLSLPHVGGLL